MLANPFTPMQTVFSVTPPQLQSARYNFSCHDIDFEINRSFTPWKLTDHSLSKHLIAVILKQLITVYGISIKSR